MELIDSALEVGGSMLSHPSLGRGGIVGLLVVEGAALGGDAVELEAEGAPASHPQGLQVVLRQIPAQIPVEFPIGPIPWIALAGAPHRQGGGTVAAKEGHPGRRTDRGIDPIARPWLSMEQAMAIQEAVAQATGHQLLVQPFVVGAFREPDPERPLPQEPLMLPHGGEKLGPHGFGRVAQEGEIAVGGGTGDQIEHPRLLQQAKACQQLAAASLPIAGHRLQFLRQSGSGVEEFAGGLGQELKPHLQPGEEPPIQGFVTQEGEKGWREAKGEARPLGWIGLGGLQGAQKGDVALLKRLEIPILFEGPWLPRADVRKMGVEHQGQSTCGHGDPAA